ASVLYIALGVACPARQVGPSSRIGGISARRGSGYAGQGETALRMIDAGMSSDLRASAGAEDAHELSSGVAHERLPSSDFELMAAVTSSRRTTLARTDSYQITLHEADTASRKVLVTFGSIKSKLSEAGFGTSF